MSSKEKNSQNTSITLYMLPVHTMAHLGLVARMHKYWKGIKYKTSFITCNLYCKGIQIKDDITRHHKREKFIPQWRKMLVEKQYKYPNFLHIIRILLVCHVSTAQVERQISSIERILGDWHLKFKTGTIEDLRICTVGPEPAGFCPESAVLRWWSSDRFQEGQTCNQGLLHGQVLQQKHQILNWSMTAQNQNALTRLCIQSSQCILGHPAF